MTSGAPSLVIFDCDGVLVDSEPISAAVVADALTRAGWPVSAHEADRLFLGGTMFDVVAKAKEAAPHLDADAFMASTYEAMFAALAAAPKISGVDEVLDALDAARIPYAVGSNGPHEKMDVTLGGAGLKSRFEGRIFSARDVPAAKPAPDLFLHAARSCGARPERCFVVGDSRNDALASSAAGMGFCGLAEPDRTDPSVFEALGARYVRRLPDALKHILDLA